MTFWIALFFIVAVPTVMFHLDRKRAERAHIERLARWEEFNARHKTSERKA